MADDLNIQYVEGLDRGLSYAESCFETFRVLDGSIFAWDYHWQRLQQGLQCFGIVLTNQQQILQQCLNAAKDKSADCLVRLTVSGGDAPWGLKQQAIPKIFIQSLPFQAKKAEVHLQGVEYPFPLMPKIAKFTSDYALTLRASQKWNLDGANTALVYKDGMVLGGITANIALFVDDQWLTPEGEGILAGTVRHFLVEQGLIQAQVCPVSLLEQTQAALLLNSGAFVQVAHSINGKTLDTSHPSTADLQHILQKQQGVRL
ncbi:MAG: aminotransferase class IV [Ghiorsea sp.]|nr:aminotransferase class IV [Ghiorsea sp.]